MDWTVLSPAFAKALFLSFVGSGGQEFYEIFDSFSAVIPQAFRLTRFLKFDLLDLAYPMFWAGLTVRKCRDLVKDRV